MKPLTIPRTLRNPGAFPKGTTRQAFELEAVDLGERPNFAWPGNTARIIRLAQVGERILVFTLPDGRTCWQFDPH